MLKGKPTADGPGKDENTMPQFKENPQVNARIDDYIKNNPKHWEYIKSMSPERMARALVLAQVQKLDRSEKMRAGIMRKLDENPDLKKHVENLVKNLPAERREKAMLSIAATTIRSMTPRQTQSAGAKV